MTTWKKRIEQEPDNLQLKFEAALFYQQNELIEEALIQLLSIVKANKEWEEKKANKAIL
jgi:thioredoxin-like negative regulator of GroEL